MEESKFTWLPKFTKTLQKVPVEYQATLFMALVQYGNFGIEPTFEDWILEPIFESLREDIDNNKSFRSNGSNGGRGKKKRGNNETEESKTPLCNNENPPSECSESIETPLREDLENENGGSEKSPSIPYQSIPNHTKPNQKKEGRFTPPTLDQVRAHCLEMGYTFDPEAFFAFYESKGWKVGRNPMKSWTAACVTWQKRERKEERRSAGDIYSQL